MTKKHFTQLAQALNDTGACNATIEAVADVCAQFNPNFQREKFKDASGWYPTHREVIRRVTH